MWRDNLPEIAEAIKRASSVNLLWLNENRVPNAGTWFTTKEYAFGGVSRDLLPHLLSLFIAFNPNTYRTISLVSKKIEQRWKLSDLTDTDYGSVKSDGIYDVDDYCSLMFSDNSRKNKGWLIETNWRNATHDDRSITLNFDNSPQIKFELGLCPEDAYKRMIVDAIRNMNEPEFWLKQYEQDMWIHDTMSNL
jgi:hypothetical protein